MTTAAAARAEKFVEKPGKPLTETTRTLLQTALAEDVGTGDITSRILIPAQARARAEIIAREKGVFCGAPFLRELCRLADPKLGVRFLVGEGKSFSANKAVMRFAGRTRSILKVERTVLNLLGRMSSIATGTARYVQAVKKFPVLILDTRKTMPVWRELDKYSVRTGGGRNHRFGLYDAIFVKENHRPHGCLEKLKKYAGQFQIEVRNLEELREAIRLKPRVILFDNFSPDRLSRAVQIAREARPETILEASGGVNLDNVTQYAAMGVDWISVGSLTHSINALDFSLIIK